MTLDPPALDASADYLSLSRQAEDRFLAKEYSQAAALWERALALNPHVTTWAALGRAHYLAKEYRPAIAAYEKALELGAGYRWSSAYDIACCYAALGSKSEALDWLEKAMDLGFRDLAQVQKDEGLQSLHAEKRFRELALTADVGKMSREEGWRFDLKVLARELQRLHYAPLTHTPRQPFEAAVHKLHAAIPKLSDDEIAVGFMRLARRMGDAHTRIAPKSVREGEHRLPVQFYLFEEGLYVIAADAAYADLAGAEVVRIGDKSVPQVLEALDTVIRYEYLPDTQTVFCQYNAVKDEPDESLDKFWTRLFAFINANAVEKLVLDMRWNGGGNNFLNKPLVEGLMRCDKINQQGKLFVVVGRNTFSAAQCGVTQIERYTYAIFVGEPTGSSPNFVGESIPISLPYSKMAGTVSDLYWQNSVAMDYRTWIAPELYAPPTFAAFHANRDPAMEAILAYHPAP